MGANEYTEEYGKVPCSGRLKPESRGSAAVWDIFCRVVDNFGDAAICWRLARQLSGEHSVPVRLWVDDLALLRRLAPATLPGWCDGVQVCEWTDPFPSVAPGEVVIAAFACDVPAGYLATLARKSPASVWLNLEYLSAEDWVEGCHRMASTHPRLGLVQHFFFPGFTSGTGGLLREQGLFHRRDAFRKDIAAQADFLRRLGVTLPRGESLRVSLFSYENNSIPSLLDAWAAGEREVQCFLPESRAWPQVAAWARKKSLVPGDRVSCGRLSLLAVPFTAQTDYDRLLWCCDLNFARGEDSCVRAQWAAVPFVWHIYPQDEGAHWVKLEAFLDRYLVGASEAEAAAFRKLWRDWNAGDEMGPAWAGFAHRCVELTTHAERWCEALCQQPDLASQLVVFCSERL